MLPQPPPAQKEAVAMTVPYARSDSQRSAGVQSPSAEPVQATAAFGCPPLLRSRQYEPEVAGSHQDGVPEDRGLAVLHVEKGDQTFDLL
jgi:hypothetical protein